jgi:hypothetical protein
MNDGIVIIMILGLVSGFGLLSIIISFFETDFEEEYLEEIRRRRKRSQPATAIPINNELDISTYDFYTDEI